MTDNAWAYKYSLRETCTKLGIRQIFIKPHCPWQNGKGRTPQPDPPGRMGPR
jgi:transposase InsO family protein